MSELKAKVRPPLDRARVRKEAHELALLLDDVRRRARTARLVARGTREYASARERVRASGAFDPSPVWRWTSALEQLEQAAFVLAADFRNEAAGKRPPRRANVIL